ncbi:hypothetical protein OZN62_02870 [Aurantiacibacter sp. MUD11]|uniref:hypothetical protein n=1 Tax=Aurantiacibacter sp. MUD11 TaxID=3003265 RepID=UPI0022AA49B2|nr:hypothetical protein [Aurantiacibacter sp. MUD11]WAT18540.1 hypothetical protein OZN62_02870 [Aurantiacibacter sp. MUD11]
MLRQLLTLLAVISGLGLSAAPAVAAEASVISVAAAGASEDCQAVVSMPLEFSRGSMARSLRGKPCQPAPVIVITPTVQLQADRARE